MEAPYDMMSPKGALPSPDYEGTCAQGLTTRAQKKFNLLLVIGFYTTQKVKGQLPSPSVHESLTCWFLGLRIIRVFEGVFMVL